MTASFLHLRIIQDTNLYYLEQFGTAHIQCVASLFVIQSLHQKRIHGFHEKLVKSVWALDNMNKVKEINAYVSLTLDKLPG